MASENYKLSENAGVINPYTFVPIDKNKVSRKNVEAYYKDEKLYTGVLDCTLKVKTPLAIPDVDKVEVKEYEHKEYPFYKIGNQYAIPGSTLRGVIRSVFETVTNSCFSTLKTDTFLSQRSSSPYKPGILKVVNNRYVLYEAERYLVPIQGYKRISGYYGNQFEICIKDGMRKIKLANDTYLKTGDSVSFKSEIFEQTTAFNKKIKKNMVTELNPKGNNNKKGLLYIGEASEAKHSESVFVYKNVKGKFPAQILPPENISSEDLEQAYDRLRESLNIYQNKSINKNYEEKSENAHNGYKGFEVIKKEGLEEGLPIWYQKYESRDERNKKKIKVYFSYASLGRVIYENSLNNLIDQLKSCTSRTDLCEACMLFGMVGGSGSENQGMGSRIRMTDAFISKQVVFNGKKVTLKELGTPRSSYLPFYAKLPDKATLSYDADSIEIAGRKYYWHHKKLMENDAEETFALKDADKEALKDGLNRNSTMELMPPETEFSFKIYYDRISKEQLQKLIWTLTLGDNSENSNQCYKLGHGKPLGLGSVKIIVENCWERVVDTEGYHIKTLPIEMAEMDFDSKSLEAVQKVLNIEMPQLGENENYAIDYPNIVDRDDREIPLGQQAKDNALARHQWYSQNKKVTKDKSSDTIQLLPSVTDERQFLMQYQYVKESKSNSGKQGGKREDNRRQGNTKTVEFMKNQIYKVIVQSYNEQKTSAKILVEGRIESIYYKNVQGARKGKIDKILKIGQEISVMCLGYNERNGKKYPEFEMKK